MPMSLFSMENADNVLKHSQQIKRIFCVNSIVFITSSYIFIYFL